MYRPLSLLHVSQAFALVWALATPLAQAADAQHGSAVFKEECSDCHSLTRNRKGPNLAGVVGRHCGSAPGYKYSDAMRARGVTWSPEQIDSYLTAPKKVVPGGKMKYDGLDDSQARADLISFLATRS